MKNEIIAGGHGMDNLTHIPLTPEQYRAIINEKVEALNAVLIEANIAHGMRHNIVRRMASPQPGAQCIIIRAEQV